MFENPLYTAAATLKPIAADFPLLLYKYSTSSGC